MTYAKLLEQLSKLSAAQLAAPVRWWGDERAGKIAELTILKEEFLSQGWVMLPRSFFGQDADFSESDKMVFLPAGTPILREDQSGT